MNKPSRISYVVWALDVWGHSGDECEEHDCPCIVESDLEDADGENHKEHDTNKCQCGYEVNDRSKVGEIVVETDKSYPNLKCPDYYVSDENLVRTLFEHGFFRKPDAGGLEIDGEEEGLLFIDREEDGKPLLQLEFVKAEDK